MLKYICAALLLLGITSFGMVVSDDVFDRTGCTEDEYEEGTSDFMNDVIIRCPNYFAFMAMLESYPIFPQAKMPKEQVCSVPEEMEYCMERYYGYLPCFKEEFRRALYVTHNITQKAAEVYCEDYEEIEKDRKDGLLSCKNVHDRDLQHKMGKCFPERNEIGVCSGISSALRCIHKQALADCSDSLKVGAKEFLQKVMDAVKTCPHVEI